MSTAEPAITALAGCRDAEDYFRLLGVEYDEQVLAVGRLHVLKLFSQELHRLGGDPTSGDLTPYRAALERAYGALRAAGPLEYRVFKVLRDKAPGQFVPDDALRLDDLDPTDGGDGR